MDRAPTLTTQTLPEIASDGDGYLVVFYDNTRRVVSGLRLSGAAERLDPVPFDLGEGMLQPSATFDGTRYLVVYVAFDRARVDATGALLDPLGFSVSSELNGELGSDGAGFLYRSAGWGASVSIGAQSDSAVAPDDDRPFQLREMGKWLLSGHGASLRRAARGGKGPAPAMLRATSDGAGPCR